MPTSLFADMERNGSGLEDQRALQIALELSMLGLNDDDEGLGGPAQFDNDNRGKKSQNMTECVPVPSSEHVAEIVGRQGCKIKALRAKTNTYIKTPVRGEEPVFVVTGRKEDVNMAKREILSAAEHFSQIRASRKNNLNGSLAPGPPTNVPGQTTIQVRVPYRVVGLVVGPKGATIKRIQQQTHTYIVTPSRDKDPVFEVTGLPENVDSARKEIEGHIAMRTGGLLDPADPSSVDFHHLSAMDHQAFTGAMNVNNDFVSSLYKSGNGNCNANTATINGLNLLNSSAFYCDSNNMLRGGGGGHHAHHAGHHNNPHHSSSSSSSSHSHRASRDAAAANIFSFAPPPSGGVGVSNGGSLPPGSPPKLGDFVGMTGGVGGHQQGFNGFGLYDTDEGIAESPTFDPSAVASQGGVVVGTSSMWPMVSSSSSSSSSSSCSSSSAAVTVLPRRSSSVSGPPGMSSQQSVVGLARLSPPLVGDVAAGILEHPPARRIRSDPLCGGPMATFSSQQSQSPGGSVASSPTDSLVGGGNGVGIGIGGRKVKRDCIICFESEVVAALVPCGHNLFCLECANRLCDKSDPECPVCHQPVTQAIRIYS